MHPHRPNRKDTLMNTPRVSLLDLAREADAAEAAGNTHGAMAAEGSQLSQATFASMEKSAMAGDQRYIDALAYFKESREMTFKDAFSRAAYFREMLKIYSEHAKPDPELVVATFFSALATKMHIRSEDRKSVETIPAIPLFKVHDDKREAVRMLGKGVPIIVVPDAHRYDKGTSHEHITGNRFRYLAPMTYNEFDCYEHLRMLQDRMASVLAANFEENPRHDVRDAVWYTLNLVRRARVFDHNMVRRLFKETGGKLTHKDDGNPYISFELTERDVLVLEDTPDNQALIERLEMLKEAPKQALNAK